MKEKKQAVLGTKNKSNNTFKVIALGVVALAVLAYGGLLVFDSGGDSGLTDQTASTEGKIVSLAAADFEDGKAQYFSYKANENMTIRFFVLKSSDGVIRAAFDACDVCWRSGRGYAQQGDQMICRNCGQRFDSNKINVIRGGCNPSPLKRTLDNDKIIINVPDIMAGAKYFNFNQG